MPRFKATYSNPGHSAEIELETLAPLNELSQGSRVEGTVLSVKSHVLRHLKGVTRAFIVLIPESEHASSGPYLIGD